MGDTIRTDLVTGIGILSLCFFFNVLPTCGEVLFCRH